MVKKIAFIFLISLCCLHGFAQEGKSLSEQINVVRPYKPILAEAVKISSNPEISDERSRTHALDYMINPEKLDTVPPLTLISPEKISPESISKLYRSYIRAAAGNYGSTLFESYTTNTRSKDLQYGTFAKRHTSKGKIDLADVTEYQASAFAKKTIPTHELKGSLLYDRDVLYFYGYDHNLISEETAKKNFRQRFNYFGADCSLKSRPGDSTSLVHTLKLKAYSFTDLFGSRENRFAAGIDVSSYFYTDQITANMGIDASNYKSGFNYNNNLIFFNPAYSLSDSVYILNLGFKVASEHGIRDKFHLYTYITGDYNLTEDILVYGGITGGLRKNSYRDLTQENPFLGGRLLLINTNEKLELFAGLRGNITSQLGFKLQASSYRLENMPFIINGTPDSTRFLVVYDTVGLVKFTGEATYQRSEKFRLAALFQTYSFRMSALAKPWHHPDFRMQIMATYNIGNKFLLSSEIYHFGKMYAKPISGTQPVELAGVTDLNLGLEYRYSKILSAFIKLNNLTGTIHERWYYYPGYGFNGLFGLSLAF